MFEQKLAEVMIRQLVETLEHSGLCCRCKKAPRWLHRTYPVILAGPDATSKGEICQDCLLEMLALRKW